jgi:16S rRNA (cytosine967-C5)-methyltransferase
MSTQALAAKVIARVLNGASLSQAFELCQESKDRARIRAICYGVMREHDRLQGVLAQLLERPLKKKETMVLSLLLVGLFQLMSMDMPDYAAIFETVSAVKTIKKLRQKPWVKGFINGVLRRFQRDAKVLLCQANDQEAAFFSHPQWLIDALKKNYPARWQAILQANNQQAPLVLRINQRRCSVDHYLQLLKEQSLGGCVHQAVKSAVVLDKPCDVSDLPGFAEGFFSVQDSAAQLCAGLLSPKPGEKILDACAAPGGKSTHLLEYTADIDLLCVDPNVPRLEMLKDNLKRLGLQATVVLDAVEQVAQSWKTPYFDAILLDAPCSGTGVIRRHPDIKYLRTEKDIEHLAQSQFHLLATLWPFLKPGGRLLYATCSVMPQENAAVINRFLGEYSEAREITINATWGESAFVGRQIFPGEDAMDGFYYCLLTKEVTD